MRVVTFTTSAVAVLIAACATTNAGHTLQEIVVDENTTQIRGWINTGAEWALFPLRSFRNYDPYSETENLKCISIINEIDNQPVSDSNLYGSYVVLRGSAIRYNDLDLGDSELDRILPKRYYNDKVIVNGCAREFVFLATSIEVTREQVQSPTGP